MYSEVPSTGSVGGTFRFALAFAHAHPSGSGLGGRDSGLGGRADRAAHLGVYHSRKMLCATHEGALSTGACEACTRPYCGACVVEDFWAEFSFCSESCDGVIG